MFVKEFIFSKIVGLLPVTLLKKLLHWYFSRSLIIDFRITILQNPFQWLLLTSFTKSVVEITIPAIARLLLDFTVLKIYVGVSYELHKIGSKLTIKTPERHQLTSLQCLYCKLYKHFTTSLVFVQLTLNMKLFAG